MSSGKIVQIIGAVIDVEFARDSVPSVYDALKVTDKNLTLEVQQQLGDGVVRKIAMGSSEGVKRGLFLENTNDKILSLVKDIVDKFNSTRVILFADVLEKKSKLRIFFEKDFRNNSK